LSIWSGPVPAIRAFHSRTDDGGGLRRRHDENCGDRLQVISTRRKIVADADILLKIYLKAMKSGLGSRDTAAVCAVLEKMAKVKRKKPRAR
jgi:hypothetical protein